MTARVDPVKVAANQRAARAKQARARFIAAVAPVTTGESPAPETPATTPASPRPCPPPPYRPSRREIWFADRQDRRTAITAAARLLAGTAGREERELCMERDTWATTTTRLADEFVVWLRGGDPT